MKKFLLLNVIILITFCGGVFAKDSLNSTIQKIGIVNPIDIYQSTPQGENSLKALQKKLKPQIEKLKKEQNKIMQEKLQLNNDSLGISTEDLKEKEARQIEKENKFHQEFTTFRQSGTEQEQKLAQNFQEVFSTVISEIAQQQGYDLILSSQAIAYVGFNASKNDVTVKVIEKMKTLETAFTI